MITSYFISSGAENKMYTLKAVVQRGEFRTTEYICNLSTDKDRAIEKARKLAIAHGIPLHEQVSTVLNPIDYSGQGSESSDRSYDQTQPDVVDRKADVDSGTKFIYGKYDGCEYDEVLANDPEYMMWLYDATPEVDDTHSVHYHTIQRIRREYADQIERMKSMVSAAVGQPGDRIVRRLRCTKAHVVMNSYGFGESFATMYVLMDDQRNVFVTVYSGYKMDLKVGQWYDIKGTVKDHDTYKGVVQTKLTRCALV